MPRLRDAGPSTVSRSRFLAKEHRLRLRRSTSSTQPWWLPLTPRLAPSWSSGHSAASTLAWMAADARPDKVARVVMIGGFPSDDGDAYADFFPVMDGVVPFPGWEPFDGPDSADLDEQQRKAIAWLKRDRGSRRRGEGESCISAMRGGSTCPSPSSAPSSHPPRPKNGSTEARYRNWREPGTWTSSTSTRAIGRCSPGRPSWPIIWTGRQWLRGTDRVMSAPHYTTGPSRGLHLGRVRRPRRAQQRDLRRVRAGTSGRQARLDREPGD